MRVMPTAQHALRQATMELSSTAFPSAVRTLASIVASITIIITIYLGYRKCVRDRDDSFIADRSREQQFGASNEEPGNAYSDEFLPVYVGDGRYVYVSRNELPRNPPHINRRNFNIPPRFDASTLKQFEAINEEKRYSCPICLEELQEEPVSAGQCLHLMHSSCLTSWLNKDINSNCPVCRVVIEESASLDKLSGKVMELASSPHSVREAGLGLNMETGIDRQDDVRLPMTENVGSIQVETGAASQVIGSEAAESGSENNGERGNSQQENPGWLSMNEVHTQRGVDRGDDASVLPTQDAIGSLTVGGSRRVIGTGIDQEVAVADK